VRIQEEKTKNESNREEIKRNPKQTVEVEMVWCKNKPNSRPKMKFRRQQRDSFRISLTPLIDTIFLLLMFFMLTTTFNRQSELKVELPEASGNSTQPQEPIRILINADGEYAMNDWNHALVNTQLETLERALRETAGTQENPSLLLSADKNAPHYAVIKAMEAARDLGFTRLGFETQTSVTKEQ